MTTVSRRPTKLRISQGHHDSSSPSTKRSSDPKNHRHLVDCCLWVPSGADQQPQFPFLFMGLRLWHVSDSTEGTSNQTTSPCPEFGAHVETTPPGVLKTDWRQRDAIGSPTLEGTHWSPAIAGFEPPPTPRRERIVAYLI